MPNNFENKKKSFFVSFWWVFPVVDVVCLLMVWLSLQHELLDLAAFLIIASILIMVAQVISFVCCICKKEWWRGVASAIVGIICFSAFSIVSFLFLTIANSQPDTFGKEHPITEELVFEVPKNEYDDFEPIIDSLSSDGELQIWNDFQGGMYQYSFYYPELPDGEVFLRCFEVKENIGLSSLRLQKASMVEVKNHSDYGIIADRQRFTIYEGDWGDYYVARVEVWHKNASTGKETKLMEKNYQVEGWMR